MSWVNWVKHAQPEQAEIILNLWYVMDDAGIIYSLRARLYVCHGTDESKQSFLQERAILDYLIAQPFPVPDRFSSQVGVGEHQQKMPVSHVSMIDSLDSPIALWEDAIVELEKNIPMQTALTIPSDPVFCFTPLVGAEDGSVYPRIDGTNQY